MNHNAVIESYKKFIEAVGDSLVIRSESDYEQTLALLDTVFENSEDSLTCPLNSLKTLLADAIDEYEEKDPSIVEFMERSDSIPKDIAVLKTLMDTHKLTGNDFENEIGGRSMVSKILNQKKTLSRTAIERLAERFNIRPSAFID